MDREAAALAEAQHGVFTLGQAGALGFTPAAIQHRLRTGRWDLLRSGVYRIPGSPPTWEQGVMATTLAAGAVASHRSAAALLGIPGFPRRGAAELTVIRPKRYRDAQATVHQSTRFPDSHVTRIDSIPCTRVARTLVDLAATVPPAQTERAIDNCLSAGLVTPAALEATVGELARPGRHGIALLRRLIDERGPGYVAPASELEARFLRLLRAAGLPEPVRQPNVGDAEGWAGRADYAYRPIRLLIELDSRRHHLSKLDFEADRARDNRRVAAGWRPLRFTWTQITRHPAEVIDVLIRSGVVPHRPGDVRCRKLVG
jgi:very-short-patch-repair endonuclease